MTNRIPLIVNSSANQIQELPSGDSLAFPNLLKVTNATDASSKTTGALQVTGGMSCQLNLHVGQDIFAFATSDKRLKDNITPIPNAVDKVLSISGNTFNWNSASEYEGKGDTGVIAQEVQALDLPGVTTIRDDGTHAVRYETLVPLLIEAIKELEGRIKTLEG